MRFVHSTKVKKKVITYLPTGVIHLRHTTTTRSDRLSPPLTTYIRHTALQRQDEISDVVPSPRVQDSPPVFTRHWHFASSLYNAKYHSLCIRYGGFEGISVWTRVLSRESARQSKSKRGWGRMGRASEASMPAVLLDLNPRSLEAIAKDLGFERRRKGEKNRNDD